MALPATEPTSINITLQARCRIGASVAGPIKKLATSKARYTPTAKPLIGINPRYYRPLAIEHLFARAPTAAADHRSTCQIMPAQDGAQNQS